MASQGPRYPTSAVNVSTAPENAEPWVSPTNVGADDAAEASITAATYDSPDISQQLRTSGYGFTIPAGATIDGIVVEIMRRNSAGAASDHRVQLQNEGNILVGDNKADTALDWPTAEALKTYGSPTDTWAASPTVDMVNDNSFFGVTLSVQADAANTDIQVDFIRMTVYYTTTDNRNATIVATGGGVTPLASSGAHNKAVVTTGGGVTPLATSGAHSSPVGSLTGGGVVATVRQKGGQRAATETGGGVIALSDSKGGQSAATVVGGGVVSIAMIHGGQASAVVTGGGVVTVQRTKGGQVALQVTGGGVVTLVSGGSANRDGTVVVTGGGMVAVQFAADRQGAIAITGGGEVSLLYQTSGSEAAVMEVAVETDGGGPVSKRHAPSVTRFDDWTLAMDDEAVLEIYAMRKTR